MEVGPDTGQASASPPDTPLEAPSEFLAAALDGQISDAELEGSDPTLDAMGLVDALPTRGQGEPLIPVEEAQAKLPPEVLKALEEKFKGSLTQVRHRDERDQMF